MLSRASLSASKNLSRGQDGRGSILKNMPFREASAFETGALFICKDITADKKKQGDTIFMVKD